MLFKGDIKLQLLFHKFELDYMFLITETVLMTIIKKSCLPQFRSSLLVVMVNPKTYFSPPSFSAMETCQRILINVLTYHLFIYFLFINEKFYLTSAFCHYRPTVPLCQSLISKFLFVQRHPGRF